MSKGGRWGEGEGHGQGMVRVRVRVSKDCEKNVVPEVRGIGNG